MSITKTRVKSAAAAVGKHKNESTTTTAVTSTSTTNCHTFSKSSTFSSPPGGELRKHFQHDSPKVLHKQKSKTPLPLSSATTNAAAGAATAVKLAPKLTSGGAAIVAGTALAAAATTTTTASVYYTGMSASNPVTTNAANSHTVTTTTTTLPQSNLLKIEPFIPSLGSRLQKPIRRSYSTLSTTALRTRLHNVNTNVVVNLEIASNVRKATIVQATKLDPAEQGAVTGGIATALPKVAKQPTVVRRRQPLRGTVNRQRSKSTSSSNSASNRPATSLANAANTTTTTTNNTPTLGTPCSSPHNAVVIAQPNGICRIQRNAKEQEKLPDRINYDKRGLTAIPIFENESNLRLLSLQHNLINTFHIPKDVKVPDMPKPETEKGRETPPRNTDLVIANSSNYLHPPGLIINRSRYPLNGQMQSPTAEYLAHGHAPLTLQNVASANQHQHVNSGFGSYMLQRNKLLHRSINLNNVNLQQNALMGGGGSGAPLRFAMRKSKSFVNNFNLQYQAARRGLQQNPRATLLKKPELTGNLKSFDSSTSNLTTDSGCALLTPDIGEEEEEAEHLKSTDLEIKNRQLLISYGNIFQHLVFLDLYNNQIERIANLDGLTALTVLLLGKNRIVDITGLASLKATLRVLDLHGNKLCSIANKINCLKELKSLNLAGNQIRQINHNDFLGLTNLKELNLKRNKLKRVNGFQHLLALERLWLCHNDLHKVDDMSTIAKASQLIEVTIENNPVSLAGDCVSFLVSHLPKLQTLSQMPITEQVRIAAMTWRTNKELSDQSSQQGDKEQFNLIRREEIISNARTNWELLRSQQMLQQQQQQGNGHGSSLINHKSVKSGSKHNKELEKINEANEQSYEEFIKLPPIQPQQQQHEEMNDSNREERTSSASSLGPNVNSSSSCYSSGDEEAELDDTSNNKHHKSLNKKTKNSQLSPRSLKTKTSNNDATASNHIKNGQDSNSTTTAASSCPPTLTIQFPVDNQDGTTMSNISMSQNQIANHSSNQTSLMQAATSMIQATSTSATPSSTSPVPPSPSSATGCNTNKRYMTGTLMRSQTIVGPGGAAAAAAANGYAIKANANASATNTGGHNMLVRYQTTKLNPANTLAHPTTIAAPTTAAHQQTSTTAGGALVTTSMTMATTTTTTIGNSIQTANTSSSPAVIPAPNSPKTLNGHTSPGFMGGCITSSMSSTKTSSAAAASPLIGTASITTTTKLTAIEREREQGGDYLIEICGRYLNIYGQGALRFIDKQWNPSKANDVHTLNFSYINFNNITTILGRIKVRFPHAENFVFRETNINCLGQLNAVAELQGITSLFIDPEGNPLTLKDLWREYAIYRLSHWGLKRLNAQEVTQQDIDKANLIYAGLSDLILWSMPDAMLQPLLTRLRLDESCTASKMLPKQWLQKPDNRSLRLVVGKEALQWKKCHQQEALHSLPTPQQIRQFQAQYYGGTGASGCAGVDVNHQLVSPSLTASAASTLSVSTATAHPLLSSASAISSLTSSMLTQRERGKIHFTIMMENTCNAVEKLHKLEQMWPLMLSNIVRNTLLDYSQLDVYLRNLMGELMK